MATATEAAAHLFLSRKRFDELVAAGIIVRSPTGFDLDAVRASYIRNLREIGAGRNHDTNIKRTDAGTRKDEAIAQRYELEVAQKRSELIPRGEVLAGMSASFARVRAKLLALPTRLAPVVLSLGSATEIQEKLNDGVHEALEELAGTIIAGVSEGRPQRAPDRGDDPRHRAMVKPYR